MNYNIDLHCHTVYSDGAASVKDLVDTAVLSGMRAIAVTDHDAIDGVLEAEKLSEGKALTVISGLEISTRDFSRGRRAHLLVYGLKKPEFIKPYIDKICESRWNSMLESIEIVKTIYPVTTEMILERVGKSKGIFKQHVFKTLMDLGYVDKIFCEEFNRLYNSKNGVAYKNVDYPDIFDIINVVKEAGGVSVLAHPSEYKSMELLEELAKKELIKGVELNHPRNTEEDKLEIKRIADEYGLIITGGTDFHGFFTSKCLPLGSYGTDETEFEKLIKLL